MTNTRPAPPGLAIDTPPCPLCDRSTDPTPDGTLDCENCGCFWDANRPDEPGEWFEPHVPACGATAQPYADNRYASAEVRALVYTCVLDTGHDGDHRGTDENDGVENWRREVLTVELPAGVNA
ncbi:hypothetical protein [Saccharopolyspora taberi]|uniref:Uncharacterized protein n=1 Tax=Saccharopolyspora taberi TaxID=60895 RepID=A0ABN3V0B9_9PSEU